MFVHQVISTSSNPSLSSLLGSHLCSFFFTPPFSHETLTHLNSPNDLVGRPRYAVAAHRNSEGVLQIAGRKTDHATPGPYAPFT